MRLVLFAVASLSLLSACGGSPCTRFKSAADRLYPNGNTCTVSSGGNSTTLTKGTNDASTCEAGYPKCSSADQTIINDYVACLEKATPCAAGSEQASIDSQTACIGKIFNADFTLKISQECANAFK